MKSPIWMLSGLLLAGLTSRAALPKWEAQVIDDQVAIGYGISISDVDGDDRPDVLLADKQRFVWYGNPDWKSHNMTGHLTERDHVCLAARDINGDRKAEVVVGAQWNPGDTVGSGSIHNLLRPADPTGSWKAQDLPHEPVTHRMRWVLGKGGHYSLVVLPLHGKGNKSGKGAGVRILAYDPQSDWKTTLVNDSLHMTHNLDVVQWDQDPEEELVVASVEGLFLMDLQKDGSWSTTALVTPKSHEAFAGAGEVRLGKDASGRRFLAAVEPMHGPQLVLYTLKGDAWTREILMETMLDGHAIACGDVLGIGGDQIVFGWRGNRSGPGNIGVKLITPGGGPTQDIDLKNMACEDLRLADLDGDGRLDVVATGRASKNLIIYWNRKP